MRKAAPVEQAKRSGRQRISIFKTFPAPVGGWNARDPLAKMDPRDALVLENFFPRVADCAIRGGAANHVTGIPSNTKALMTYTPATGTNRMFASTDTSIYDVTSAGAVGAAVAACTNGKWQHVQMGTSAGSFLLMANGVDLMKRWDNAAWTNPAITGPTATSNIINLNVYKRRLFLIEVGKLNFWYLPVDVVAGAAVEFQLGPLCRKGGYTVAMGTWSLDAGDGPDDYAAFVTSEGELILFTGTDPGTAADWSLAGVFYVSKPLGRRCFRRLGGDLILLTEQGAVPISQILKSATIERTVSLTNKIESAFTTAARSFGGNFGWEGLVYPAQSAFIFNVPTADGVTSEQYVMNLITKSWCKFTGWNAFCWAEFNKEIYFGSTNKVAKAWTGTSDFGANIMAGAQTAYNYMGDAIKKRFQLCRPLLLTDSNLAYSLGLSVDFKQQASLGAASYSVIAGAIWDVSLWDSSYWAAGLEVITDWQTVASWEGFCASLLIRVDTNMVTVQWAATDYFYEHAESVL